MDFQNRNLSAVTAIASGVMAVSSVPFLVRFRVVESPIFIHPLSLTLWALFGVVTVVLAVVAVFARGRTDTSCRRRVQALLLTAVAALLGAIALELTSASTYTDFFRALIDQPACGVAGAVFIFVLFLWWQRFAQRGPT